VVPMRRPHLTAVLVLAACAHPGAGAHGGLAPLDRTGLDAFVGREWVGDATPIPDANELSGWLIQLGGSPPVTYGMSIHAYRDSDVVVAALEVGRSGNHARWRTTDVAWLPPRDSQLLIAASECTVNDTLDRAVFALVRATDTPWYDDVRLAWRLDATSGRIEPIGTARVRCQNEGYGA
jgi:hypothetical protein